MYNLHIHIICAFLIQICIFTFLLASLLCTTATMHKQIMVAQEDDLIGSSKDHWP